MPFAYIVSFKEVLAHLMRAGQKEGHLQVVNNLFSPWCTVAENIIRQKVRKGKERGKIDIRLEFITINNYPKKSLFHSHRTKLFHIFLGWQV